MWNIVGSKFFFSFMCLYLSEAIPISYVVPVSSISLANPGVVSNSANSPRTIDGRSVTSEDARSDSGKSEEDGELYDATSPLLQENTFPVNQIIRVRVAAAATGLDLSCISFTWIALRVLT